MSNSHGVTAVAALAFVLQLGCSKSLTTQASSGGLSKSLSSPFKSSSKSSGGDEAEVDDAFRRDIRDQAAQFAAFGGEPDALERNVGRIALGYGIVDWERQDGTYVAIGRGFAEASLTREHFETLAVRLAREDYHRLRLLESGFEGSALR